jgi:hypothetical protein
MFSALDSLQPNNLNLLFAFSIFFPCSEGMMISSFWLYVLCIKCRLIASDTNGGVNVWDRRMSALPCLELTSNSRSTLNSIKLNVENQVSTYFNCFLGKWYMHFFPPWNEVLHHCLTYIKTKIFPRALCTSKCFS